MANAQNIAAKAEQVQMITEKIQKASSVVLFDYRGLTVAEVTELRNQMRAEGVEYMVVKNHIVGRACEACGISGMEDMLKGPSAFAFSYDDAVTPARILKAFMKKVKKCEFKGGLIEGAVTSAADMDAIAELPSREVLLARLLGSMMSPISGLAIVLDQIAKKQAE